MARRKFLELVVCQTIRCINPLCPKTRLISQFVLMPQKVELARNLNESAPAHM